MNSTPSQPAVPIEIEHKYLLSGVPEAMPVEQMEVIAIEQGYLRADEGDAHVGRVRRLTYRDGRVLHRHAIKRGFGLVREEIQRDLSEDEFAKLWPQTAGRRLTKTRHQMTIGDVIWVVDVFDQLDLVLAEAEKPTVETPCPPPAWIEPYITREVTDDREYTNANLARLIAKQSGG